ncbi:hypothetical protein D3C86_1679900 [compost metagenome]
MPPGITVGLVQDDRHRSVSGEYFSETIKLVNDSLDVSGILMKLDVKLIILQHAARSMRGAFWRFRFESLITVCPEHLIAKCRDSAGY